MQLQFGVLPTLSGEECPFQIRLLGGRECLKILTLLLTSLIFNSQANVCVNHYLYKDSIDFHSINIIYYMAL